MGEDLKANNKIRQFLADSGAARSAIKGHENGRSVDRIVGSRAGFRGGY